jgi:hypothetical protein
MDRKVALLLPLLLSLAACSSTGDLKVPFTKEKPFVPTAVPSDFAVVVDENHDTYYTRQHIRQQVTSQDAMSKTTYTTRRDYNNAVSNSFSQETPLSPVQLQNMWNDVARYNLMEGSSLWINWRSDADIYRRNSYTLQIRANGQTRTYTATNGFSGKIRPLILQVEAVRLPITQDSNTPVIERNAAPAMPPPGQGAAPAGFRPLPGTRPSPETQPAAVPPAAPAPATAPGRSLSAGLSDGVTAAPATAPSIAAPSAPAAPAPAAQEPEAITIDRAPAAAPTSPAIPDIGGTAVTPAVAPATSTPAATTGANSSAAGTSGYSQMKTPVGNPANPAPASEPAPTATSQPAATPAPAAATATEPAGYHQLKVPPR